MINKITGSLPNTVSQNDPESVQAFRYPKDDSIPRDVEIEIAKRLENDGKVEDEEDIHLPWVPEVFFSLGATELSGEAESRSGKKKTSGTNG